MILTGLLKNVTFRNPENGWSVLRVESSEPKGIFAVVGTFPQLESGETISFTGEWIEHSKFGRQFQATHFETVIPTGGESLIQYLSSGLFKGMGPVSAKRIVDCFGENTLHILDNEPKRLEEIKGLSGKRLKDFQTSWKEQRESRDTLLFLYGHQITGSTALRLWKQYRRETVAVIQENPYILAEEVWGIGFIKADEIALKMGLPRDSYQRLRSGIRFALTRASTQGHTFLPRPVLLEQSAELLRLENDEDAQNRLLYSLDGIISDQELEAHEEGIWLPPLWRAEQNISRWIRASLEKPATASLSANLEAELRRFEKEQGIQYAPEQFQGICAAVTSPVYILTGGPGTGKTTTLRGALHLLDLAKDKVLLAAPTGRAARRMSELTGREASTLHRLLEIDPATRRFMRNGERPLEASVVVVDEFSMVDTWICSALIGALAPTTRLLLIGDQDQLPSIGPGSILRELLSCDRIPSMRLSHIFRQQGGSDIAENAHRINLGQRPNLRDGTHFHYCPASTPEEGMQIVVELMTRTIPATGCNVLTDAQVLTPMHKGPLGTLALNPRLQDVLNPHHRPKTLGGVGWRQGDRVMQLKNDYERNIFNGDIGFIVRIDLEEQEIEINFEGRKATIPSENLGDLGLAYACTVHKSQGSEYKAVVVVLDSGHYTMLQRNLLYTGVTRAKGGIWIVATPGALDQAIRNNRLTKRYTKLAASIRDGGEFMDWLRED